ncbi:Oxoglutarate/iron-dependent dioxygenase [Sesbania bispinosa]|nr:Oxoglutarate/iron-dependent dioxygenase [Sesbania bispinosa]
MAPSPTVPEISPNSNKEISFTSVKALSESPEVTTIPSSYTFNTNPDDEIVTDPDEDDPIPIIDYFLLVHGTPDQRAKTIHDIGKACEQWGIFMLINHSVSKSLMENMVDEVFAFSILEKRRSKSMQVLAGSLSLCLLTLMVERKHVMDASAEYSRRTWKVGRELLKGISESLGLEANYIDKTMNLDSGLQMLAANLYPPCPQPELAMGMPPHSDHGLLNLLMQNGVSGLQVLHNGKWINVSSTPNCFLVLVSDHLEIMSNGKYKSVLHRAVVSNRATRMSLASVIAPSLDTVVEPASELLDKQSNPTAYVGMKHRDYMELQRSNHLYGKSVLDKVKI